MAVWNRPRRGGAFVLLAFCRAQAAGSLSTAMEYTSSQFECYCTIWSSGSSGRKP